MTTGRCKRTNLLVARAKIETESLIQVIDVSNLKAGEDPPQALVESEYKEKSACILNNMHQTKDDDQPKCKTFEHVRLLLSCQLI